MNQTTNFEETDADAQEGFYYCDPQHQVIGPFRLPELRALAADCRIGPLTLVCRAGSEEWREYRTIGSTASVTRTVVEKYLEIVAKRLDHVLSKIARWHFAAAICFACLVEYGFSGPDNGNLTVEILSAVGILTYGRIRNAGGHFKLALSPLIIAVSLGALAAIFFRGNEFGLEVAQYSLSALEFFFMIVVALCVIPQPTFGTTRRLDRAGAIIAVCIGAIFLAGIAVWMRRDG